MLRMLYPQLKERSANHFHTAVGPQNLIFHIIQAIKDSISPAGSIAGPFPVSLVNPGFLDSVSSKLNSILSEKVTTV